MELIVVPVVMHRGRMLDERKRMPANEVEAFLAASRRMTFCGVGDASRPFAKVFDVVYADGELLFHGAPRGEKLDLIGREVVMERHEVVADIPSYFTDEQRACPATTLYRSVQLRGRVELVADVERKALLLQRLMEQRQRRDSFVPMDPARPDFAKLYAASLRKLLVARVSTHAAVGRMNLAQHKPPRVAEMILEGLYRRGDAGDLAAIEAILTAYPPAKGALRPPFMHGPHGLLLRVMANEARAKGAARLLEGVYWREGVSATRLAEIQLAATAFVAYEDEAGELVACARAVSDNFDYAYIGDVIVAPNWRGRGVGSALVDALLDHPRVRGARHLSLLTVDAQELYAKRGFAKVGRRGDRDVMALRRDA